MEHKRFWKVRLWGHASQPKEKERETERGRKECRKKGRKEEPCGGREENKSSGEHAQDHGDERRCPTKMQLVEARGLGCLQHRSIFK